MRKSAWFITCFVAGLTIVLAASAARAQFVRGATAGEGQISAAGHVHLQRPPTHLKMYLQLTGKGKTLEEALAALKERREAAAAKLRKIGVEKSALVITPPGVDETVVAQQRQMEMMIAQRLGGRAVKKEAKTVKPPVTVTCMLTAQWPLTGDTTERLLLAADNLHEKVKAAELAGGKEAAKLSPEEQEVADEMAGQMAANMGGEEQMPKPGEPHFVFVARLAPQDRQAALADAFAKAKTQAAELAKAAGAGLGPLTGLSGEAGGEMPGMNGFGGAFGSPFARYNQFNRGETDILQQIAQTQPDAQGSEAMGTRPDGIAFDFVVNATFSLFPGKQQ